MPRPSHPGQLPRRWLATLPSPPRPPVVCKHIRHTYHDTPTALRAGEMFAADVKQLCLISWNLTIGAELASQCQLCRESAADEGLPWRHHLVRVHSEHMQAIGKCYMFHMCSWRQRNWAQHGALKPDGTRELKAALCAAQGRTELARLKQQALLRVQHPGLRGADAIRCSVK